MARPVTPRPVALESFRLPRAGEAADPAEAAPAPETPDETAEELPPEPDPEAERLERLARIAAALETVAAEQGALRARWLAEAAGAFGAAAEQVVPRLARAGFAALVAEAVESLAAEGRWPRLALAAAPDDAPAIEAALAGRPPAGLELRADPALGPGEVRLGWDGGGAEIDVEAIAGAALAELGRALATANEQGA